jgi:hypothetical protein
LPPPASAPTSWAHSGGAVYSLLAAKATKSLRSLVLYEPALRLGNLDAVDRQASIFPTLDEVAELLPKAKLCGMAGQRHLAFAFDPMAFAQTVLAFTRSHDQ